MEKITCYTKCYGGYIFAIGAGGYFGTNLWIGIALLAAAGIWAYKRSCCANCVCGTGCCKK